MNDEVKYLKYLSPFIGIMFCPFTILFLWSISTSHGVDIESERTEQILR